MFNIGAGEFLVIALIALIVLGPQRLPAAARQAEADPGDPGVRQGRVDQLADIMTGRLSLNVVAQGQDDLRDGFILQALLEGGQIELFGTDPVDGREASMQYMVGPAIGGRAFDGHEVRHQFDHADRRRVPPLIQAHGTVLGLGQAAAAGAPPDRRGRRLQGLQHGCEFGRAFDQQVERQSFGGPMTQAGEKLEQLADLVEGRGHDRSHPRQVEARRGLGHRRLVACPGLGGGLLQGGDQGRLDEGPILAQESGVKHQGVDQAMPVDDDADRAPAMTDLQSFRGQSLLGLRDPALHLLGLFEELAYAGHKGFILPNGQGSQG